MPTTKPRIQVSVKPSQYALLQRLAKLQGRSMASVIGELFDQMEPVYERVAVVLQAAVRAQQSMKDGLRESTEQAERDMAPFLAQAMGQLDLLVQQSEGWSKPEAAADGRTAQPASAAAPRAPLTPAPVTRGSGLPTHTHKTAPSRSRNRVAAKRKKQSVQSLAAAIARKVRKGKRA
jgi:hypothetical protein